MFPHIRTWDFQPHHTLSGFDYYSQLAIVAAVENAYLQPVSIINHHHEHYNSNKCHFAGFPNSANLRAPTALAHHVASRLQRVRGVSIYDLHALC